MCVCVCVKRERESVCVCKKVREKQSVEAKEENGRGGLWGVAFALFDKDFLTP